MGYGTMQPLGHISKSSTPGISNFFCKGLVFNILNIVIAVNIFGIAGCMVFVTTAQLCHCGMKTAIDNVNEHVYVLVKLYEQLNLNFV